jgi:RHS repeat-associated protein
VYSYTANTNKLASAIGEKTLNFSYDNDGNTTLENARQYIYNQNQRLIQTVEGTNVLGEYVYNGNGQRVKKLTNNGAQCTVYHYDKNGMLIAESSSSGTVKAEYIYLNGQPLANIENNNIYYYHNDHLGTSMMMTDETVETVWEGEYLPFGEAFSVTGSITNNLRFPGQYFDDETGLHYNYYRDYNPVVGRYVEADPVGIDRGENHLFVYVRNNAVNWIDPEGTEVKLCNRAKQGWPIRLGPVHHSYVDVNGTIYGFHPENNKALDKGKVEIEQLGKDIKCGQPLKCVDDSCILQKINATSINPPNYSWSFYDCRAWAKMIILLCHKKDCCE